MSNSLLAPQLLFRLDVELHVVFVSDVVGYDVMMTRYETLRARKQLVQSLKM